jgi:hypothetical protein
MMGEGKEEKEKEEIYIPTAQQQPTSFLEKKDPHQDKAQQAKWRRNSPIKDQMPE